MKIFSGNRPRNKSEAWSCLFVNLLATPGLGTLLARRLVAGILQLLLSLAGFVCVTIWFIQKMRVLYGQAFGTKLPPNAGSHFGWIGLLLFVVAWLWSLVSSIQILHDVPKNAGLIPPKIV